MQRTIDRLKAPYTSNCASDWSLSNLTSLVQNASIFPYNILVRISHFFVLELNNDYCFSQQCRRFCLFDHFRSQCGCFFSSYLDSDSNRAMFQISKWYWENCVSLHHKNELTSTQWYCFYWWFIFETLLRNDLLPCDITSGGSDEDCVGSVIEEMDAGQKKCQCNVQCEELDYQLSISQALWPSNQYEVRTH